MNSFGKILNGPNNRGVSKDAADTMAASGFSDFGVLDISGWSGADDIDLSAVFGTGKVFRAVKSTDSSDGSLYVKTLNDYSEGYVAYPLKSGEKDILLTPITHIRQTSSITGVIVFWQEYA